MSAKKFTPPEPLAASSMPETKTAAEIEAADLADLAMIDRALEGSNTAEVAKSEPVEAAAEVAKSTSSSAGDARHVAARDNLKQIKKPVRKSAAEQLAEAESRLLAQKRSMHLMKSISPIIGAVISSPGTTSTPAQVADAINKMTSIVTGASQKIINTTAPNLSETGWANAEVFAVFAGLVASEWRNSRSCAQSEALMNDDFMGVLIRNLSNTDDRAMEWLDSSAMEPPIRNEAEAATRIRMSLLKGFAPLLADIQSFSFWKSGFGAGAVERFKSSLFENLAEVAASHANNIAFSKGMSDTDRLMLWQGSIKRVFDFAREEYRVMAGDAFYEVDKQRTPGEKSSVRKQWALEDIEKQIPDLVSKSITLLHGVVDQYIDDNFGEATKPQVRMRHE